jgi:hypothetical protein
MNKTALFFLTMTLAAGAGASEFSGIRAADIKAVFAAVVPAPSAVRTAPATPGASICEAAMSRSLDFRTTALRDAKDQPLRGFESGYYTERGPMQVALVLQTGKEAFYYYEDCDICAAIDKCDLKTGAVKNIVTAHSADCSSLAPFASGAVYSACAKPGPACSRLGDAVRIPAECCSGKADPAYGGEMVCVEAVPVNNPSCGLVGDAVRIPEECCSGNAEPAYGGEMVCVEAAR